jgi:hypothetical protein
MRVNALTPQEVAEVYRRQALAGVGAVDPAAQSADPLLRRALFFQAADVAGAPAQRTRFVRAILDEARRSGSHLQAAGVLAPLLASVRPAADLGSFAESGVEILLVAGEFDAARQWAEAAGLWHWPPLIDIADPTRRGGRLASLRPMEDLAAHGRLGVDILHRLATALDALDIEVPLPIWDAASRTPQPAAGYLPETGLLAALGDAAKRNDAGRTILLAMRALGPNGPEGANVLALGDAVRALKRIGLEAEARQLALEALLPAWPRTARN